MRDALATGVADFTVVAIGGVRLGAGGALGAVIGDHAVLALSVGADVPKLAIAGGAAARLAVVEGGITIMIDVAVNAATALA